MKRAFLGIIKAENRKDQTIINYPGLRKKEIHHLEKQKVDG
jgi:hypothetical protein